ncbi:hypothetical protein FRC07_002952, partial [Ceratobasidium sp. 392]
VVDAAVSASAAIAASQALTSGVKRLSLSEPPQKVESRPQIYDHIRAALVTEWEPVKKAIARTGLQASLANEICLSLFSAVGASEKASAIRSATVAAQNAARSEARALATQASHDAAWDYSLDNGELEDDYIGRAGLSYIADRMISWRGLPRSEHAEAMRWISESALGDTQPGWMAGCNAGWVVGWHAGRRAAKLFIWDRFEDDFPIMRWSGEQDVGWDEAWDRASSPDRMVACPNIPSERPGRTEYNEAWDAGWSVGWQDGFEVGREPGRELAKRAAIQSWESARTAAITAAFHDLQASLSRWELRDLERERSILAEEDKCFPRQKWDITMEKFWDKGWGCGPLTLRSVCADIAQRIVDGIEQAAYSPEITVHSNGRKCKPAREQRFTHHEFQSYVMDHISSHFDEKTKVQDFTQAIAVVNSIWIGLQRTPHDT